MKYLDLDKIGQSQGALLSAQSYFMRRYGVLKTNFSTQTEQWKKSLKRPQTWLLLIGGLVTFLLLVAVVTYVAYANSLGSKDSIVNAKNTGAIIYDRTGNVLYAAAGSHSIIYTHLNLIPKDAQNATIAIEDKNFYQESAFSPTAILKSIYGDIVSGDPTKYGASTITQQLVRSAFLSPNKNFLRKYQELVLAIEISRRYSKDDVLEMYLNTVYYGSGAYGLENAAQTYFGIDTSRLDLAQSALLAGLPNAPSYLSPLTGDANAAKTRQELILDQMAAQGYITTAQAKLAKAEVLHYKPLQQTITAAPHFSLWILDQLNQKYGEDYVGRAGLRVTTSLDLGLQQIAEKEVSTQVTRLARNNVTNGALISINPTNGQVLAMVGSADYNNDAISGKVNIVFANRQPGSSIKPIVYLKALETHTITGATTLQDVPTNFNGYSPKDFDLKFRGALPARYALAQSLNVPAVQVLNMIGPSSAVEMAQRLHITTLDNAASQCGLSLVLGGCEVNLLELTRAYGVIANYGNYVDTTSILKITDSSGNVIFQADTNPQQVNLVDPQYTYIMSNILSDQNAKLPTYGTGGVAALTIAGHKAAVKTGTTENFRDAWTLGFTPNLVTGVWVGNSDGSYMDSIAGSLGAAPIWRNFMQQAGNKVGWQDFNAPGGIEQDRVCYGNGLLSNTDDQSYTEVFAFGTAPTGHCQVTPPPVATPSGTPATGSGTPATQSGQPVATGSGNILPLP